MQNLPGRSPLLRATALWVWGVLVGLTTTGISQDFPTKPIAEYSISEMAAHIDQRLAERWDAAGVAPADQASDAEFLRRAYLDLAGVPPSVSEARVFLADSASNKRAQLVERLLHSPRYAMHMANKWRDTLVPELQGDGPRDDGEGLHRWLEQRFVENLPYDAFAAEFLIADRADTEGPGVFYTALDLQPEKLAARTSQVFLGIQMQCAQCHDHPFDDWSQKDFWGYAAFFARIERKSDGGPRPAQRIVDREVGEVMLPETSDPIAPKLPRGREVSPEEGGTRRQQLSIWMASRDNPYLAQAFVNRTWADLFGRGFVEPIDDMNRHNSPSHPELLDELSEYFARTGFDIRRLMATIANTEAYQRSSMTNDPPGDAALFASMQLKTLTPDQLYDSLQVLVAFPPSNSMDQAGAADRAQREAFVSAMRGQARSAMEYDRGAAQALMLMNGPLIGTATQPESGRLLAALNAPFLADPQRVEILFLATLTRYPTAAEQLALQTYLAQQQTPDEQRLALGDALWAIVNSAEYTMNH